LQVPTTCGDLALLEVDIAALAVGSVIVNVDPGTVVTKVEEGEVIGVLNTQLLSWLSPGTQPLTASTPLSETMMPKAILPELSEATSDQCCETPSLWFSVDEEYTPLSTLPAVDSTVRGPL
jgi:hypothetical protein